MRVIAAFSVLLLVVSLPFQKGEGTKQKQRQHHFVFIHGLGHGAWCWYKVVSLLEKEGQRAVALDLTSNGINKAASAEVNSLAKYSQPLIEYLESLDNEMVTLVGHSMAGCVLPYAMELYPHKISKAVFIAGFMPRNNQSFLSSAYPQVFPRLVSNGVVSLNYSKEAAQQPISVSFNLDHLRSHLYNESPEEVVILAKSLLTPAPYPVAEEVLKLTEEKYGQVRRFYIMTMKDNLFLPQHQEITVTSNPPERVFALPASDHSPFYSCPLQLCNLLIHIATL